MSKNNHLDVSVSKIVSSPSKYKIVRLTLRTVSKKWERSHDSTPCFDHWTWC